MTIHNPLYLQNKGYPAKEDRLLLGSLYNEGIISTADLVPSITGGLVASIAPGHCVIYGDTHSDQGAYKFLSDSAVPLTFTAPVTNPRIDMVVARIYDSVEVGSGPDSATIEIIQGTSASGANLTNLSGAPALASVPSAMPIAYFHVPTSGALVGLKDVRPFAIPGFTKTIGNAASQNMSVDIYGSLATPDKISGLVVPAESLIAVNYRSRWTVTAIGTGNLFGLATFLNGVQTQSFLLNGVGANDSNYSIAGPIVPPVPYFGAVLSQPVLNAFSDAGGFQFTSTSGGGFGGAVPTTGLLSGGWILIDVPVAGTYDLEIKWRRFGGNTSAGSAQDRKLRAFVCAP